MKCRLVEEGWKDAELLGLIWSGGEFDTPAQKREGMVSLANLEVVVKVEGDGPFVRKLHFSWVEMSQEDWAQFLRQV